MKSKIVISSVVWSVALATHELPAQTVAGSASPPVASPPVAGPPSTSTPPASTTVGPIVMPRSTVHHLPSTIVDDVYELRVVVPEDYGNDTGLRPVVYALDGQWNTTLISDIVGKLAYDGSIPDPIVVGITWAEPGALPRVARRSRDFTPVPVPENPVSGGAARFMEVLEREVFPLVESTYRASDNRVITGGSLGGLFVSYALLARPDLFTGYVASSGATSMGQEYFTRRLEEISPEALCNERAYFSVGDLYDVEENVSAFVGDLEAAVGESSRIVLDVVPGVGHTGNEPFAYTRGLLHAFQRPRLRLSERFLERYEGSYFDPSYPDAPDLIVEAGRNELYITEGENRWAEVFVAASPTQFYAEGIDIDLVFHRNDEGQQSFTLNFQRTAYEQVRR